MLRLVTLCTVLGGCYAPSVPAGVPCDPEARSCPGGQVCARIAGDHVCAAPGTEDSVDAAPADTAIADAPPDGAASARSYPAAIAECLNPLMPDPQACRALNGNAQLVVDLMDSTTNAPWLAFLRFEIDDVLDGRTITSVKLRVVATDATNAPGPDSGSVFRVEPFTLASLSTTAPARIGDALAGTRGAVAALDVVDWPLPVSLVTPGRPVFLGIFPNDANGINYWNLDGATPPRLILEAE